MWHLAKLTVSESMPYMYKMVAQQSSQFWWLNWIKHSGTAYRYFYSDRKAYLLAISISQVTLWTILLERAWLLVYFSIFTSLGYFFHKYKSVQIFTLYDVHIYNYCLAVVRGFVVNMRHVVLCLWFIWSMFYHWLFSIPGMHCLLYKTHT